MTYAESKSRVATGIPTEQKDALKWLAHTRSSPDHECSVAMLLREAVEQYLMNYEDLPQDAREKLPDDFFEQEQFIAGNPESIEA